MALDPPPSKIDGTGNNYHSHEPKACSGDSMHNPGIVISLNMIDHVLHLINMMHHGLGAISEFDQVKCHPSISVVS